MTSEIHRRLLRRAAAVLLLTAAVSGCAQEEKVVRYNPFLANVPGAETKMGPVGERFKNYQDPSALPEEKTVIENKDGTVTLVAKSVRHLMINIQLCLEHDDSELLFEQVMSEQTKQEFQSQGKDPRESVVFLKQNQAEIAQLFSRMPFGEQSANVILQQPAKRTRVLEVTGLAAKDLKFTELWAVLEKGNWKLLWIR